VPLSALAIASGLLLGICLLFPRPAGERSRGVGESLGTFFRSRLVYEEPESWHGKADAIYILGGSQPSLKHKFRTASILYGKGICRKMLILSRPGITEFSSSLGRNLTNNEWALWKLEEVGISKDHVEAVVVEQGFFGTLAEAKAISTLIRQRGYRSVILLSSAYHTRRVKSSFEKFSQEHSAKLYIVGSAEGVSLWELMKEFAKLQFYRFFLVG
jgi:uncharacterized SAM-binding protein YcdF (DUF218 family)